MPVVDRIGHKHVSLDIRPEHYQIVGNHLIASIQVVLGDAATPEIIDAWTAAYQQLANLMSGHEANLFEEKTAKEHDPHIILSGSAEDEFSNGAEGICCEIKGVFSAYEALKKVRRKFT